MKSICGFMYWFNSSNKYQFDRLISFFKSQ